jgi:hypothetical protein
MHVSKNRLAGSLADTALEKLLEAAHKNLLTGQIVVQAEGKEGSLQLRAGAVDEVRFGDLKDDPALAHMKLLKAGTYELTQRLPDLGGELGSAAALDGEVTDIPITAIMRHCEDHALSCTLIVVAGYDRGEIVYKAGDLAGGTVNAQKSDDAVEQIVGWKNARFRVQLPPLDPGIDGWPAVTADPTAPFHVDGAPLKTMRAADAPPPDARAAARPSPGPKTAPVAPAVRAGAGAGAGADQPRSSAALMIFVLILALCAGLAFAQWRWDLLGRVLGSESTTTAASSTAAPY